MPDYRIRAIRIYSRHLYGSGRFKTSIIYWVAYRGQLTKTSDVENYPGYPDGVMGPEMMEGFHMQACRMGADLRIGFVSAVDFSQPPYKITIDEKKVVMADSVIIATGATLS